jgi:hypothetical protein
MTEKLKIVGVLIAGLALLFACIVAAVGLEASDLIHRHLAAARARLRAGRHGRRKRGPASFSIISPDLAWRLSEDLGRAEGSFSPDTPPIIDAFRLRRRPQRAAQHHHRPEGDGLRHTVS